jgi:hypothetical protein
MHKTILLVLLFAIMHIQIKSQCSYADYSNNLKELLRKRVKDNEPGFRYGNPHPILCFLNESINIHIKTPNR